MRQRLSALVLAGALTLASVTFVSAASARGHAAAASRSNASITSFALAYVGYRYAYMGDTPWTGFSCTGFVHWVYSHFGYNTPEDPYGLSATYPHVATSDLQPGDILLFANTFHPGLSHAAIYLGNGQMVGANNFSVGVHVDYLWDSYWGPRFVTALRVGQFGMPAQNVQGFSYQNPASQAGVAGTVTVHISSLRQRSGPGFGYGTIGWLPYGAQLQVLGRSNGWVNVSYAGRTGWVAGSYAW